MQIAYHNRTMLSNAESRSLVRWFSAELSKASKMSERKPILDSRTDQQKLGDEDVIALESAQGTESGYPVFGKCIASARYERTTSRRQTVPGRLRCDTKLFDQKECPMEFKESDFIRNPVVQNQVFFLESKCTVCGLSILIRSMEELIEREKLHRTQCGPSNAAA